MRSNHPLMWHLGGWHLSGWIERIPGGTRQNDGLETGIVGGCGRVNSVVTARIRGARQAWRLLALILAPLLAPTNETDGNLPGVKQRRHLWTRHPLGPSRAHSASRSLRRALLTPRVNPGHSLAAARELKSSLLATAGGKGA